MHPDVPAFIEQNNLVDLQRQMDREQGMYDNENRPVPNVDASVEASEVNTGLRHLQATDEELRVLLAPEYYNQ